MSACDSTRIPSRSTSLSCTSRSLPTNADRSIRPGRGFAQAASLVDPDYDGWLTHDGWAVYDKFLKAGHQSCVAHLIRRCRDMAALATPMAARFPLRVQALLEDALALRDRYLT